MCVCVFLHWDANSAFVKSLPDCVACRILAKELRDAKSIAKHTHHTLNTYISFLLLLALVSFWFSFRFICFVLRRVGIARCYCIQVLMAFSFDSSRNIYKAIPKIQSPRCVYDARTVYTWDRDCVRQYLSVSTRARNACIFTSSTVHTASQLKANVCDLCNTKWDVFSFGITVKWMEEKPMRIIININKINMFLSLVILWMEIVFLCLYIDELNAKQFRRIQ